MCERDTKLKYIALIGDIMNSKEISNRFDIQEKLKYVLKKVNVIYTTNIACKFIITLGDEFQGLLSCGENVLDIIEYIQQEMYPVKIRFGIGIGKISTDIDSQKALGADGPCYYKAREAIENVKKEEQKSKTHASYINIQIENDTEDLSKLLNTVLSLISILKDNWTNQQRETIKTIKYCGGNQVKCAKKLNIAQSSVQRRLSNGNYYSYKKAIDTLNLALKEITQDV